MMLMQCCYGADVAKARGRWMEEKMRDVEAEAGKIWILTQEMEGRMWD